MVYETERERERERKGGRIGIGIEKMWKVCVANFRGKRKRHQEYR